MKKGGRVVGTLVQGGVGGAAYFVAAKLGPKVQFFQDRWWALPTTMLVAGHVLKRWSGESGAAVCGAAGAMMAQSYYVQAGQPAAAPAASGIFQGEAGAYGYVGPGDAGALVQRPPTYRMGGRYARSEAGALIT